MRRLISTAMILFASMGFALTTVPAGTAAPSERPAIGGDLSMIDFNVKPYRVPATGMVRSTLLVRTPIDSGRQTVALRVRSSNRHVFTPRTIVFRSLAPGTSKRVRVAIQPGRKARGMAKITVTNGQLLASDTIKVTPPTPGAGNWRNP